MEIAPKANGHDCTWMIRERYLPYVPSLIAYQGLTQVGQMRIG
jgi:hypothetical protein